VPILKKHFTPLKGYQRKEGSQSFWEDRNISGYPIPIWHHKNFFLQRKPIFQIKYFCKIWRWKKWSETHLSYKSRFSIKTVFFQPTLGVKFARRVEEQDLWIVLRAILNFTLGPQGWNLLLGGMFTPLFVP
jgi:hypothetical protein